MSKPSSVRYSRKWLVFLLKEKQDKIDKAIKYIENNNLWTSKEANGYSYMKNECNELLEILKGSDKE